MLISARDGAIRLLAHEMPRPMGIATTVSSGRRLLAVSTAHHTLVFSEAPQLRGDFSRPDGPCDAVFLPRASYYTGDVDGHDLAFHGRDLLVANTRFSCVARVGHETGFEPIWTPPFVTALDPQDRCHLNGIVCDAEGLAYVTSLGVSDAPRGWRRARASGGALMDARSGAMVLSSLCVPHSPRLFQGRLMLCESGLGAVIEVAPGAGIVRRIEGLPGFTRGLDACGDVLFVGLSKLRAKGVAELPVGARADTLLCGVAAVARESGVLLGWLALDDFEEVFDVRGACRGDGRADRGAGRAREPRLCRSPRPCIRRARTGMSKYYVNFERI